MSITYQQAKRIRKTGLMDLFADQLMYEKKIGTAIKKTISLKTRAKVKGITQYFDPLNIAKVLTFGSSLGPALLGHLMKRDPKDIQYFTGRLKPIRVRDTASKISKVPGGEGGFSAESKYRCNNEVSDGEGGKKECGNVMDSKVNLLDIKPTTDVVVDPEIQLTDKIVIKMKYPEFGVMQETADVS